MTPTVPPIDYTSTTRNDFTRGISTKYSGISEKYSRISLEIQAFTLYMTIG